MDEWSIVPMFEQSYEGTLRIVDLAAPHLEHRPFFPRLIIIWMGRLTGWDISFEYRVNVFLAFLTLVALVLHARSTVSAGQNHLIYWSVPILSVLVFSLNQWENWLWGWQIAIFLSVFSVVAGLVLLAHSGAKPGYVILAMILGVVATYSFADGLLIWPLGLIAIGSAEFRDNYRKILCLVCWMAVGAIAFPTYFSRHHSSPEGQTVAQVLSDPGAYLRYVGTYLGSPLSSTQATMFGAMGTTIAVAVHLWLLVSRRAKARTVIPYSLMAIYAIASALGTGIGRAHLGVQQASVSRYMTISSLLWLSNLSLLFLIFVENTRRERKHVLLSGIGRWAAPAIILTILVLATQTSVRGMKDFGVMNRRLAPAREALQYGRKPLS